MDKKIKEKVLGFIANEQLHKTAEVVLDHFLDEGLFKDLPAISIAYYVVDAIKRVVDNRSAETLTKLLKKSQTGALSEEELSRLNEFINNPNIDKLIEQALKSLNSTNEEYREIIKGALRCAALNPDYDEIDIEDLGDLYCVIENIAQEDLNFVFFGELPNINETKEDSPLEAYFSKLYKLGLIDEADPYAVPVGNDYDSWTKRAKTVHDAIDHFAPSLLSKNQKQKETLSLEEILSHKNEDGITFDDYTKEKVASFFSKNSFFFHVAAYRENWKNDTDKTAKKYISTFDFSDLIALYHIDEKLRQLILYMTLSIEQQTKTILLNHLSLSKIDGFRLTEAFLNKKENKSIRDKIRRMNSGSYSQNLVRKYAFGHFPIWALVETLSFGDLIDLSRHYWKEIRDRKDIPSFPLVLHGDKNGRKFFSYLETVRRLRNAAAHNNCLINDLRTPTGDGRSKNNKIFYVVSALKEEAENYEKTRIKGKPKKTNNRFVHDFTCLLLVYFKVMPPEKKLELKEKMDELNKDINAILYDASQKTRIGKNDYIFSTYVFLASLFRFLSYAYTNPYLANEYYDDILCLWSFCPNQVKQTENRTGV